MNKVEDFGDLRDYDPGEAFRAKVAYEIFMRLEEAWEEEFAEEKGGEIRNATNDEFYFGLYEFVDDMARRMKTAVWRTWYMGREEVNDG